MRISIALAALVLPVSQALAFGEGAICDKAALAAAEAHGVPPQVMLAITRVETGHSTQGTLEPWPWAVNNAGEPFWFASSDQAEMFINEAINTGQSNIDIGCFQLNLRWHGANFESARAMLEPSRNADHAARFLAENYRRKGNWVDAVAAYHSETPEYAAVYIEKVERVLANLEHAPMDHDSGRHVSPRENRFPLLQPGDGMALASLVPSGPQLLPLFGPAPFFAQTP